MKLLRRLFYWRSAAARESQLREEMQLHQDLLRQELEDAGFSPQAARDEVHRRFGSPLHHAEESRAAWLSQRLTELAFDLRYAARLMRRSPGVTAVAVLSAALGIGVCTTIFAIGSALLERPLRVEQPATLISIGGRSLKSGNIGPTLSWRERIVMQETAQSMQGVAAYFPGVQGVFGGAGEPVRHWGAIASANYFDVVRPRFSLGGGFLPQDDQQGRPPAIVISHRVWQSRFNGDPSLAGRSIDFNGRAVTVMGVTAPGFSGADTATFSDFWIPFSMFEDLRLLPRTALDEFDASWLLVFGRLQPGHTLEAASREFDLISARLRQDHQGAMPQRTYQLEVAGRLFPAVRGAVETVYFLLMAAALLVLLIACANIANLLLARAAARQREIATRLSIGAGRGRLVRQLLTESVSLAALGGALGLALCRAALPLIENLDLPLPLPVDLRIGIDGRVVLFALLSTLLTGLVFGLAPAWKASRQSYVAALKGDAWKTGRRWNLRDFLVVAQVMTAVVLLISAGLTLRSLHSGAQINVGVGAQNLLLVSVDPGLRRYTPQQEARFFDEVSRRISALAGVQQVSTTTRLPLGPIGVEVGVKDERRKEKAVEVGANLYSIGPGYFQTIGVPVLLGEEFAPRHQNGDLVAIVNQAAARKLFGADDPIGLALGGIYKPYRVIGVVADHRSATIGEPPRPAVFLLRTQTGSLTPGFFGTYLVVRTAADPLSYLAPVRAEIRRLDANMAILDAKTWAHHRDQALFVPRIAAFVVAFCGAMGFLIAAIGLYGVIRYSVERRTREIGIRLALGSTRAEVLRLVIKQGAWLTAAGLALGLAVAALLGRAVQGLLYGIAGTDPLTYALVVPLVAVVALIACWLPARRAARLSPVETLRYD